MNICSDYRQGLIWSGDAKYTVDQGNVYPWNYRQGNAVQYTLQCASSCALSCASFCASCTLPCAAQHASSELFLDSLFFSWLLHFPQKPPAPLLHCPIFSQIHLCSIAGVPQFLQPSLCWEGSILSKLILDDLKGSSAKNKQTMNAKMVTGPPRIGEGPGFDSQGNVISLPNTAFPTCIKSIGSYWVSY